MQIIVQNGHILAIHDSNQEISGRYPGGVAVAVPDETSVAIGQPWEVDLEAAKTSACKAIDATAETLRNAVLTPGSGQMAAYQAKEEQAWALLADPTPTEGEYPDIFNEIGITAASAGEVAMAVVAAAERWRAYGRSVERVRLSAKKAVAEASGLTAVLAARNRVDWPPC
ncbi:hypothetical protein DVDV_2168 [Desulfovibrio sp. DV]|uniref:hypothetical protein n=1 Tax=Desulfovibrio sp. DV TaxID=1844708 RepID=UPI00094BC28C|nr:hypothetical protein [Desulfovibrio sp. DV]OLN27370.1 hypothetical protein DVDV_2168 [Desulfovibrio sp. DV]